MTSMKFGLPGGRGELNAASPDSKLVQARAADDLGYDSLWLSEQHFAPAGGATYRAPARYGPSSPLVLAAAIAASTRRIRIGFAPLLVQLHDPVRLAEDIVVIDGLSGGRVNLGIGPAAPSLAGAFRNGAFGDGRPMPTVEQALDVVLGLWAGRPVQAGGTAHHLGPEPAQRPHPPVFVTANEGEHASWAAGRGYPVIVPAMLPRASLARLLADFAGHGGPAGDSPVERFCLVAGSDAEARELALPMIRQLTERYARGVSPEPPGLAAGDDLDPERFCEQTALVGSPATVAGKITELRDQYGIGYVNLRPSLTGLCPLPQQRVTVRLFAAGVMPRFRQEPVGSPAEAGTRP
jgi:alkanesulfonate monooxygenase SsuD/methylene tetrahydromethanopterin reductase-like flavin-dependent oxidoreductase (luciferase family)